MKTLNEYMSMSYKMEIIEDQDEGGFVISYPDLPGCITCGETIESAMQNAKDAKREWIRAALEEFIGVYKCMSVPSKIFMPSQEPIQMMPRSS